MGRKNRLPIGMTAPTSIFYPGTVDELVEFVRATPRVVAVGAGTKPRLAAAPPDFAPVSLRNLSGVVEYEPSEFTFTARAGTPLREVVAALGACGQYLPFDPMLAGAGATLGGTVAAGLNGPGRIRFGGLRDFILGVKLVDGEGRLLSLGGKVVKNAAGFDVPKFLVGSAGRFGVIAELTFKVFPRPLALRTLRLDAADGARKAAALMALARGRWELDALDAAVGEGAVFARIASHADALDPLTQDLLQQWPGAVMTPGDANLLWQSVTEMRWTHTGGTLAKAAITPRDVPDFIAWVRAQPAARGWVSCGGNAGFASCPAGATLTGSKWPSVTLRGDGPLYASPRPSAAIFANVERAFDPKGKFPPL